MNKYKQHLQDLHDRKNDGFLSHLHPDEWAIKYCGSEYSWKLDYLTEARDFLRTALKGLVFLPRTSGKSQICISENCQYILETYNPVLIVTSGPASADRIYREARKILQSDVVTQDYGSAIFSNFNGNKREILIREDLSTSKDPLLRIMPRQGDTIGAHPRRIWIEDIIQEEFRSYESNQALKDWFSGVIKDCATYEPGKETQMLGTGTRKGKNDFYSHLIDKLYYPVHRKPALNLISGRYPETEDFIRNSDNSITVPMNLGEYTHLGIPTQPLSKLLESRAIDPYYFSINFQNEPKSLSGVYFKKSDLHEVDFVRDKEHEFIISVDPGVGLKKDADQTAIICMTRNLNDPKRFIIVDIWVGRTADIASPLRDMHLKWGNVVDVVIESAYYQKILVTDRLQDELHFELTPLYNRDNKVQRILNLKKPLGKRWITIWKDCKMKQEFIDELLSWIPAISTASRKDDQLDSMQSCYETWLKYAGEFMGVSGWTPSQSGTRY